MVVICRWRNVGLSSSISWTGRGSVSLWWQSVVAVFGPGCQSASSVITDDTTNCLWKAEASFSLAGSAGTSVARIFSDAATTGRLQSVSKAKVPLPSFQTNQEVIFWLHGVRRQPLSPLDRKPWANQCLARCEVTTTYLLQPHIEGSTKKCCTGKHVVHQAQGLLFDWCWAALKKSPDKLCSSVLQPELRFRQTKFIDSGNSCSSIQYRCYYIQSWIFFLEVENMKNDKRTQIRFNPLSTILQPSLIHIFKLQTTCTFSCSCHLLDRDFFHQISQQGLVTSGYYGYSKMPGLIQESQPDAFKRTIIPANHLCTVLLFSSKSLWKNVFFFFLRTTVNWAFSKISLVR